MIELLDHLHANGFACYVASGGSRDFMRPVTEGLYGISPDRVIGSTVPLEYRAHGAVYQVDGGSIKSNVSAIPPLRVGGNAIARLHG